MAKVRFRIAMSLDGYTAGPRQSKENPLGIGGHQLHEWAFPLAAWRALHGLEGGEVNESTRVVEESPANIGAMIMGRNMFGGHPGPWDAATPWNAWWGVNPPFSPSRLRAHRMPDAGRRYRPSIDSPCRLTPSAAERRR